MKSFLIILVVFIIFLVPPYGSPAGIATEDPFDGFDEFVKDLMEEWAVTGLSVAVVQDGDIIYARGFGYRDLENRLPVTPETIFAIGSITKSFTATALGILVDDGLLDWDTPVRDYLPEFRVMDTYASENMTPRDLLSHRSGLPRHDLLWYGSDFSREELFRRLHHLEPSKTFREVYQYNNLMYMVAGVLIEAITGSTWEEFVRERILDPLNMERTNFSVNVSKTMTNAARPSTKFDGETIHIPFRNIDAMGPAGSINSNAIEMANWLILQLSTGTLNNTQIISSDALKQIHMPHKVIPDSRDDPELFHASYGLGWRISSYRGHLMLTHGGAIDGFIAHAGFLPDDGIGVIILTNFTERRVNPVIMYNIFDRLLGLEVIDWNVRVRKQLEDEANEREEGRKCLPDTSPTHSLETFAGKYEHPAYGLVSVMYENGMLSIDRAGRRSAMKHCHFNVFEIERSPVPGVFRPELRVQFHSNREGKIDRFTAPLDPSVDDIVFKKIE